jgi:hypothetical protein
MKTVRIMLATIGSFAQLCAVMSVMALPYALEHYSREPEDTWLLVGWAVFLGSLATSSLWIATKNRA